MRCLNLIYFYLFRANSNRFRQKTLHPKLTQAEGFILGVGAKMFAIAWPVFCVG